MSDDFLTVEELEASTVPDTPLGRAVSFLRTLEIDHPYTESDLYEEYKTALGDDAEDRPEFIRLIRKSGCFPCQVYTKRKPPMQSGWTIVERLWDGDKWALTSDCQRGDQAQMSTGHVA